MADTGVEESEMQAQRDLTPLVQPSNALLEEEREANSPRWTTVWGFTLNSYNISFIFSAQKIQWTSP